ncbi:MAG TPA: hypothetical protein VFV31_05060 [Chitinophagaceae bacterium]|nr:hypothetical protein [Chitinophagaceae bacterium]
MKSIVCIIGWLFTMLPGAVAQADTSFRLIRTIKGDIEGFTVDNLDNIYILTSRNQVKKYNAAGDSVAIFNDVRKFGKATLVDVSNPLKILLYYKDFATVVMLDRFLNIVNTIDLRKQNIFQARAIGQSYDNKVWVFDEMENKLKKIDENGKLIQETPDFRLLFNQPPSPVKIFDENKYVYLYDPANGINVFDYYGTLKNNILITGWQNLKVAGNYIFGSRADTLFRYEISRFMYDDWKMPPAILSAKSFSFSSSRLYAWKENSIEVYSIR